MSWIADAISIHTREILTEVSVLVDEVQGSALSPGEVLKQAELTLELLMGALDSKESAPLFDRWEAIGRSCSEGDLPMSDIPRTTDILKRAIWAAMEKHVEAGEIKLNDLVDAMMVVESVLSDCWFMMVHSYLGSRDIRVTARAERMESLYTLTEVLSTERDDYQMFRAIVDKVASITKLPRCSLLLTGEDGQLSPAASNFADTLDMLQRITASEFSALSDVVSLGGPVILEKGHVTPEIESILVAYHTPLVLLVPLRSADKDLGVLLLDAKKSGDFTQEQIDLAIATANQVAIAIEKNVLVAEMETRLKHMAAIGIVARSLTSHLDPKEQMESLLEMGCALVRADSGVVLLQEEMFDELEEQVSTGDTEWTRTEPFEKMARWVTEHHEPLLWDEKDFRQMNVGADVDIEVGLMAPMLVRDKSIGIIAVGSSRGVEGYSKDDLEMFKNFAAQAAVSIENTQLYERLQDTYLGAIGSLAAAIEARDPYTVGHSARVTQYAVAIAESMGLNGDEVEEIRLAGLLHDLGKIGVPDNILNKPGRLSEEEYSAIKMHPALSMRIIEPLPQLGNIIPIIYHHHERFDGNGYIEGKAGEKIPLGARIIAVADSFEAMTSDRPYRSALSRGEAIAELMANSGSQFDPRVVDHFLKLLKQT
ncbi:MAG TPA: HD domain-containing phosphohydrolase [Candidatus Anoxymicrobiaceae bacterium]